MPQNAVSNHCLQCFHKIVSNFFYKNHKKTNGPKVMYVCVPLIQFSYQVAQRYGTMAAHTPGRASVLVMFIVCLRAHVQFCQFDKGDANVNVQ